MLEKTADYPIQSSMFAAARQRLLIRTVNVQYRIQIKYRVELEVQLKDMFMKRTLDQMLFELHAT